MMVDLNVLISALRTVADTHADQAHREADRVRSDVYYIAAGALDELAAELAKGLEAE